MSDKHICKVSSSGTKEWYLNSKFHREDGPAVEYAGGDKEWWLNGKLYSYKKWLKKVNPALYDNKIIIMPDGKRYLLVDLS